MNDMYDESSPGDSDRNKLGQPLKGANPEYDCKGTSGNDLEFVEEPGLTQVISVTLGEAEASLLERQTSGLGLDMATIFGQLSVEDIKRQMKLSHDDVKLKSLGVEVEICEVQYCGKGWEVVVKVKQLKKQREENFEPDSSPAYFMAFVCIFFSLILLFVYLTRADEKGAKSTCFVRMPSHGCAEDQWYRIEENKTETKICDGMVCSGKYKKEKTFYYDTCNLVLRFPEDDNVTFCNSIQLKKLRDLSRLCPEVILEGKYGNKEDGLTNLTGRKDIIKPCLDAYNKRRSVLLSCEVVDLSATSVVLSCVLSVIIVILIHFINKCYCKSRKGTLVEPLLAKNKELLSSVTVV